VHNTYFTLKKEEEKRGKKTPPSIAIGKKRRYSF
jgi:hypothetical protein